MIIILRDDRHEEILYLLPFFHERAKFSTSVICRGLTSTDAATQKVAISAHETTERSPPFTTIWRLVTA